MNLIEMKYSIIVVLLLIGFSMQGQSGLNNPLGNSIIQHESNPIDLATGLPSITVPLFSMPTLADDLTLNMVLGYHPSSVAVNGQFFGNCGRGWTIPTSGVIVGAYSSSRSYFNYSFMGYSGKFYVQNESGILMGFVAEKNSNVLFIEINHDATTYKINSFTIHDHKGYKYIFQTADSSIKQSGGFDTENYMFQITQIKDSNDATLATFNYKIYGTTKIHNLLQSIVTHHGKIQLENSLGTSTTYNPSVKFTKMIVRDFKNNFIRRFDFSYIGEKLSQIDESDHLQTSLLSHKFYYKENPSAQNIGMDEWGYQNSNGFECPDLTNVTPSFVTNGVLQKISLPTGGAILYEFESNTYAYSNTVKKPIDQNNAFVTDPLFFSTFNYKNLHNFQRTPITSASFSASSNVLNFNISGTKKAYFEVFGNGYNNPASEGGGGIVYPTFRLQKNGVTLTTFMVGPQCSNSGMGAYMELTTGNYTLTMMSSAPTTGSVTIDGYTPTSTVKKWHYGNGIRIKRIGYFESDAVNQRFYEQISLPFPGASLGPVKETLYDYNLVDDPTRSSGCIFSLNAYPEEKPTVIYKNVTVTESGNVGRTVYTLYSPLDYYQTAEYEVQEPNFSKIKQVKIFKEGSSTPIQEKEFLFNSSTVGTHNTDPRFQLNFKLSSSLPAEIRQKDHSNGTVETVTTLEYDSYRKLANSRQSVSPTGDIIHKKYFYHWLNSATSKNRRVIEKIETYRNTDLLFTDKIHYTNSWGTILEPGGRLGTILFPPYVNVSYLPLSQQSSKGSNNLLTEQRFNLYDGYSRLWESEKENGIKTVYIWGYNHTQIVAQIENATYSSIPQSLVFDIVSASNNTIGGETVLKLALDSLRGSTALNDAMITTYIYKPLIGISSVTDEKKQTIQYFYDAHNRLEKVKDHTGKILTENEYNIRIQN